jgi:hypothetical protein
VPESDRFGAGPSRGQMFMYFKARNEGGAASPFNAPFKIELLDEDGDVVFTPTEMHDDALIDRSPLQMPKLAPGTFVIFVIGLPESTYNMVRDFRVKW